jgi:hypothetical protein
MKLLAAMLSAICLFTTSGCCENDGNIEVEESNGSCPSSPEVLVGHTPNGSSCRGYEDCEPVCCSCPDNSGDQYLIANCNDQDICNSTQGTCGIQSDCGD